MHWLLAGLLTAPPVARIEINYETEPSGYRIQWNFEEVRPGPLPGLPVRGPENQDQLMILDFQPTDEGTVRFDIQILEDQKKDGKVQAVSVLNPKITTNWGQEATLVTSSRAKLKRFGKDRWQDVRVELRLTAWLQDPPEPIAEPPDEEVPEATEQMPASDETPEPDEAPEADEEAP
jgi:hypothetical protein